MPHVNQLNDQFPIPGLRFETNPQGMVRATIQTPAAEAELYLQGAHVTRWKPAGHREVLWLSRSSWFESGKPIRGGIPICFPWFGPHPVDPQQPAHGTARISNWNIAQAEETAEHGVKLWLTAQIETFQMTYTVEFGHELKLGLQIRNSQTSTYELPIEEALHTYFSVSDIRQVSIEGLQQAAYIDKMDNGLLKAPAHTAIRFDRETDRIYVNTEAACTLHDPNLQREIVVGKRGSLSTVVWNPWIAKAARMPDFGDDEWQGMVCIESANVATNALTLAPGESHGLQVDISVNAMTNASV
ncbi:MAG: D-hexose-6-phosphate mutarotase [Planctomycetaceae bacterium]|nr:D-hexose-6-phosphate mutarotase [Planctomycetaceae bacterium]